jgi:hypothetical protein
MTKQRHQIEKGANVGRTLIHACLILLLLLSSTSIGSSGAQAANDDCTGGGTWFKESMMRMVLAREANVTFLEDVLPYINDEDSFNPDSAEFVALNRDFQEYAQQQDASAPPDAAIELNRLLTERLEHYAAAYLLLSQWTTDQARSITYDVLNEMGSASDLGMEAAPLLNEFVEYCDLDEDLSVRDEVECAAVITLFGSDWYTSHRMTMLGVYDLLDEAIRAMESGDDAAIEDLIEQLDDLSEVLQREEVFPGASELHDATIEYVDAAADALDAYLYGSDQEFNDAADYLVEVEDYLVDLEEASIEACEGLGAA